MKIISNLFTKMLIFTNEERYLTHDVIKKQIKSFKRQYFNEYKSYLRECEANNVINSLNCDGFDIGSRC